MHMRFLSRGFKNLQWYGMTAKRDILSDVSFCFTRLILPFPRETTR